MPTPSRWSNLQPRRLDARRLSWTGVSGRRAEAAPRPRDWSTLCTDELVLDNEPTCAICGSVTRDGLFPPGGAHHLEGPDGWVPLCRGDKAAFLRGQQAFP